MPGRFARVAFWMLLGAGVAAHADPWLAPGDELARHDIELLADAGILRGPVTTWPISWPDVARDALAVTDEAGLDSATAAALMRVKHRARAASARGFSGAGLRVAGTNEPETLRSFGDSPRADGEVGLRASWLGDHLAFNAQVTGAVSPEDDRPVRADGSYIGVNIGNFMVSAGLMERWWGPGWDGSLILSTNARPIPTLTLERNYSDPFKLPILRWIGPWRASIAVGQAEGHDVAVPDVRFLAARVNFKPRPWLEFGVSRTAQWCGEGRSCGWGTFTDMLIGRDNRDDSLNANDEPGNQMAGYDARIRSPWRALPVAVYTQWIGEDEAGGLPSKFMGLFGIETWASTRLGSLRVRAEAADTACTFTRAQPDFNCGYRNALYPQGYAYRGRIIGHSMDNDSRMASLAAFLVTESGTSVSVTLRHFELNRDGTGDHAISPVPLDLDNVEFRYSRDWYAGRVSLGIGYDDTQAGSDARAFLSWQQGF